MPLEIERGENDIVRLTLAENFVARGKQAEIEAEIKECLSNGGRVGGWTMMQEGGFRISLYDSKGKGHIIIIPIQHIILYEAYDARYAHPPKQVRF